MAFMDPYRYIGMNETIIDVKQLHDFMMEKTTLSEYQKLRPDIRDTIGSTRDLSTTRGKKSAQLK